MNLDFNIKEFLGKEIEEIAKKKRQIISWDEIPEKSFRSIPSEEPPAWKSEDYLKAAIGWVYSCVSAICDDFASINLRLYRVKGEDLNEIFEHPLLDLLYKVNPYTTKYDHFWLTQE